MVRSWVLRLHPKLTNFTTDSSNTGDAGKRDSVSPASTQDVSVVRETAEAAKLETTMGDSALSRHLGRLVLHDGGKSSRYVNSGFMSKLNDEVGAYIQIIQRLQAYAYRRKLDTIRNDMETYNDELDHFDDQEPSLNQSSSQKQHLHGTDHTSFLFGYRSADVDLSALHPTAEQTPLLWQIYQENVEMLLKVVHVPTMDKLFRNGVRTNDLVPEDEALIFAIYFAAVASMEDAEVSFHAILTKHNTLYV